jgi:hypothetical protein
MSHAGTQIRVERTIYHGRRIGVKSNRNTGTSKKQFCYSDRREHSGYLAHEQKRHTGEGTACSNTASAPKENIVSHCSTKLTKDCNCKQLEIAAESKDRVQTEHKSAEEKHEGTAQQKQRIKPPKKNCLMAKARAEKKRICSACAKTKILEPTGVVPSVEELCWRQN